jgi:DNA polymerase-2
MIIWLKTRSGRTVRLIDDWQQHFYVAGDHNDLINLADQLHIEEMSFEEKFIKPEDDQPSTVLKVPVRSTDEAEKLAEQILVHGRYQRYEVYNVDVKPAQFYMYEKAIYPFAYVKATPNHNVIHWELRDNLEPLDYETPPLKEVTLSINFQKKHRLPAQTDSIDAITIESKSETYRFDGNDEKEKLLQLIENIETLDPDIIYTTNGDDFLFPYLAFRAKANGVADKLVLGREQTPLRLPHEAGRTYTSYGRVCYRPTPIQLFGRFHIDRENSILYSDCGLPGVIEVARLCRIPVHRVVSTTIGTSMTSAQLYEATRQGILIPWRKANAEELKTASELLVADRGGFYYEPIVGLHESVGELDFLTLPHDHAQEELEW